MLRTLYIKNYALIDEFTVQFRRGLNVITGETGAGKSIVLGAFGLLIGERASSDLVRRESDKAIVEAEFDLIGNPRLEAFLVEHEIEQTTDALIIRREVKLNGNSRGFVNDSPVTTQFLKELGNYLVDLHGQHEHQSLLHADQHIRFLDEYSNLESELQSFEEARKRMLESIRNISDLKIKASKLREEHDLIEFQFNEISAVSPLPGEDDKIERDLKILENAESLRELATEIHDGLYESEHSAFDALSKARQKLERMQKIDTSLAESLGELSSALRIVEELSRSLHDYSDRVETEPSNLEKLRLRAQSLGRLKKKYGGSVEAVLSKLEELGRKLEYEDSCEQLIGAELERLEHYRRQAATLAERLHEKRGKSAKKLTKDIVEALAELGIEHPQFDVHFEEPMEAATDDLAFVQIKNKHIRLNTRGYDSVEFLLSANAGEDPKPLVKVASGGEVSRIMLSLKTVLARSERLPLLVFDEIDVGISGRIAQKVGRAMKILGASHQIISISHLPQIAAASDAHYLVEKSVRKGVTSSELRELTSEEHIQEVAKLISGDKISTVSLQAAEELIQTEGGGRTEVKFSKSKVTKPMVEIQR